MLRQQYKGTNPLIGNCLFIYRINPNLTVLNFGHFKFGFVSDFGFSASDLRIG